MTSRDWRQRGGLGRDDALCIVAAIRNAESRTSGEIRVHVERRRRGDVLETARLRFSSLGMGATDERNGVLVLVALDDRKFAFVGDDGIHAHVGGEFWLDVRARFSARVAAGDLAAAVEEAGFHRGQARGALPSAPGGRQ